ncbi:hypothetical protein [Verminephrobacter eiseniae]|uniref:hypothetical protein n=1 Tax=Verminephrobacter eiseniae TaxID=364317 RepID=UPI0010EC6050|nr:hypothetical protein [Verminephrobacter eiseniae]KAB7619368.1 hypothetical protein ET532_006870 [Verminephrobacter sp. Larva24]
MVTDKPNTLPPCLDLPRIFLMATPASAYAMKQALAICHIGLKISSRFCIPIGCRSMNAATARQKQQGFRVEEGKHAALLQMGQGAISLALPLPPSAPECLTRSSVTPGYMMQAAPGYWLASQAVAEAMPLSEITNQAMMA